MTVKEMELAPIRDIGVVTQVAPFYKLVFTTEFPFKRSHLLKLQTSAIFTFSVFQVNNKFGISKMRLIYLKGKFLM